MKRTSRRAAAMLALVAGIMGFLKDDAAAQAAPIRPPQPSASRPAKPVTVHGPAVRYHDGQRWVDVVVADDELAIETADGTALDSRPLLEAAKASGAVIKSLQRSTVPEEAHRGVARLERGTGRAKALDPALLAALEARGFKASATLYDSATTDRDDVSRQVLTRRFSIKLREGQDIAALAKGHNFRVVEEVTYSPRTWIAETQQPGLLASLETANSLFESGVAEWATPLIEKRRVTKAVPNDALYPSMWHLKNTGQSLNGVSGNDIDVEDVWDSVTGEGVNIAIVDDGLETAHPDLAANARTDIDIDVNFGDDDPSPGSATHGTACAGVAAAVGNNSIGVVGAAFDAGLVGVRLLATGFSDADSAEALNHLVTAANAADIVHISSNSWGPSDNGQVISGPGALSRAALLNGITNGRDGLGTVYVWAGGNGHCANDYANYDGWVGSIHTIGVAASGADGTRSYYSERGTNLLVNAPSNYGACDTGAIAGISTTDLSGASGVNSTDYRSNFGGTSSATPLAAGVIALLLEANPLLTWRDVQDILVKSAVKNDPTDPDWKTNGAGHEFNHSYGFGRVNAAMAIAELATHDLLEPNDPPIVRADSPNAPIPADPDPPLERVVSVTGADDFIIEHVEVDVVATHTYRGDIVLTLESPSGMISDIAIYRPEDSNANLNFTFMSVAHWGESPNGDWTLRASDGFPDSDDGSLISWTLRLHGRGPGGGEPTVDFEGWTVQ